MSEQAEAGGAIDRGLLYYTAKKQEEEGDDVVVVCCHCSAIIDSRWTASGRKSRSKTGLKEEQQKQAEMRCGYK